MRIAPESMFAICERNEPESSSDYEGSSDGKAEEMAKKRGEIGGEKHGM